MSEIKLMRCPFCGGNAKFEVISNNDSCYGIGYSFVIRCSKCNTRLPRVYRVDIKLSERGDLITSSDERKSAVEAWNRRADGQDE